jgi:hypothetical protein
MALKVKVTAPGGFASDEGYRRAFGIQVDFVTKAILFPVVDYRDKEYRKDNPSGYVNNHAYQVGPQGQRARQSAVEEPGGKVRVIDLEGVPSYDEFMGQPLSAYLEAAGPETTIGAVLGAIAYGYARTRAENAGAVDV